MSLFNLDSANEINDKPNNDLLDRYINKIVNSDTDALSELYQATSSSVYGFALSILKNIPDAEDVLHDTYLVVFTKASGYKSKGKPLAWILTITRNLCLLKLRNQKKTVDLSQDDLDSTFDLLPLVTPEDRIVLKACMNSLSDDERQIIILHAVSGFKHREIADLLLKPLSTVLSRYNRAIKKLRVLLETDN